MGVLASISNATRNSANHFIRLIPSHTIQGIGFVNLKKSDTYFVGIDSCMIFLGSHSKIDEILKIDLIDNTLQTDSLIGPKNLMVYKGSYIRIEDSKVFLFDGLKSEIWTGTKSSLKLNKGIKSPNFAKAIPMSAHSFLLRCINKRNESDLVKFTSDNKPQNANGLLQKQLDGLFCTDGLFLKVPNSNKIFYTYYYRNQFICADTNLNLLYRGKTIDTNIHAKIKVVKVNSKNQLTLASPPVYVNKRISANEKHLFIQSALKADNETDKTRDDATAIDVYNVSDGKYKLSFYLPNFDGKRLTDFKVYRQSLYALYGHYLYKYKLNF